MEFKSFVEIEDDSRKRNLEEYLEETAKMYEEKNGENREMRPKEKVFLLNSWKVHMKVTKE